MTRTRNKGFTLIELMIVVVIVGILASVALPAYREHVRRGNRAAAQSEMMSIANLEQQYLIANRVYADDATLGYVLSDDVAERYNMDITLNASTEPPYFLITFTAKGAQLDDGDLTLNSEGAKTPEEKWQR